MDLVVRNIRHSYSGLNVLQDVSLTARSGEIVAILGPSGCGKSTLLRIMGGLEKPASGEVLTRGAPPAGTLNPLTYVFQDFALIPWMSVAENVMLPLLHHPMSDTQRMARVERSG